MKVARGDGWELRHGAHEDVLADVAADALITDPPYGRKTHDGHRAGATGRTRDGANRRDISYASWSQDDVQNFVDEWAHRVRGWMVGLTSDDLIPAYRAAYGNNDRYPFHPLPCVMRGMTCRMAGDGPSSEAVYAMVARPRTVEFARWGTLRGHYYGPSARSEELVVAGGKPEWLMRALVRDYSRPGDLVVDPCAGGGTTLLAAVLEGRRAIGAEVDEATFDAAVTRLSRSRTVELFAEACA